MVEDYPSGEYYNWTNTLLMHVGINGKLKGKIVEIKRCVQVFFV